MYLATASLVVGIFKAIATIPKVATARNLKKTDYTSRIIPYVKTPDILAKTRERRMPYLSAKPPSKQVKINPVTPIIPNIKLKVRSESPRTYTM